MIMKAGKKYVKLVYDENGHIHDVEFVKNKKDADNVKSPVMQHMIERRYGAKEVK